MPEYFGMFQEITGINAKKLHEYSRTENILEYSRIFWNNLRIFEVFQNVI